MKKILCIDGGGMRGYLAARILVELEARTGKPCCEQFDLIAGTSIGGIVGALLAAGVPATEALEFFTNDGPRIFRRRWFHFFGLTGPRYGSHDIEKVLCRRLVGSPVKTRLLIPALDLKSQQPYFFKFGANPCDEASRPPLGGEASPPLWKAARATSAAQTYFPAFKTMLTDGEHVFWDGGNVANNPAVCAYAEARKLGWYKLRMLSLGCGAPMVPIHANQMINAGIVRNASATVEMLFAAGSEDVDYQMEQFMGGNYIRIQPSGFRCLPLDDASEGGLLNLKAEGENHVRQSGPLLDKFLSRGRARGRG